MSPGPSLPELCINETADPYKMCTQETYPNCFISFLLRHCSSQAGLIKIFTQFLRCKIPHGELIHYGNTESAFSTSLVSFDKQRFVWSCHCTESTLFVSSVTFDHRRFARSGKPCSRRTSAPTVSPAKPYMVYRDC